MACGFGWRFSEPLSLDLCSDGAPTATSSLTGRTGGSVMLVLVGVLVGLASIVSIGG